MGRPRGSKNKNTAAASSAASSKKRAKHSSAKPAAKPAARKSRLKSKSGARKKGKAFELEVAHVFDKFYPNARRGIGQVRSASEVPDVDGTPFWIEAKHRANAPSIFAAYEQAADALKQSKNKSEYPSGVLVVAKETNGEVLVGLPFKKFMQILEFAKESYCAAHIAQIDQDVAPENIIQPPDFLKKREKK